MVLTCSGSTLLSVVVNVTAPESTYFSCLMHLKKPFLEAIFFKDINSSAERDGIGRCFCV